MKTLYDFIYCDSVLTTRTVFYRVRIGTSKRDQCAKEKLTQRARSPDYFFCRHNTASMLFIENCAMAIYQTNDVHKALNLIRCVYVDVVELVKFMSKVPPSLLNGLKIKAVENPITSISPIRSRKKPK